LKNNCRETFNQERLIGKSNAVEKVKKFINIASQNDYPILILGETGVGKTIVAKWIHKRSRRKTKPFLHQGCSNIPSDLFESELFGHEKGAFSGAIGKKGKIEISKGGTLFLDEISDLNPQNQAKFLHFLDCGRFYHVGGNKEINSDIRIIGASNKDLIKEVKLGKFRKDLYFRLNIIEFYIPPLKYRKEDINLLAKEFLHIENNINKKEKILSLKAKNKLLSYDYPGNIRELRNTIKRAFAISEKNVIEESDIIFKQQIRLEAQDHSISDILFNELIKNHNDFWEIVHKPFLRRELTKFDVKKIIKLGLMKTNGSYKKLLSLFNISESEKEYKRFMKVLSVHDLK